MHAVKRGPVGIYARFSSELQNDRSIEDQVRRCRDYIAQVVPDFAVAAARFASVSIEFYCVLRLTQRGERAAARRRESAAFFARFLAHGFITSFATARARRVALCHRAREASSADRRCK